MRVVVSRGSSSGTTTEYLLSKEKQKKGNDGENPIFHTNMFGETVEELTEELRFSADLNEHTERTYVHYKVSFPPGEDPDMETKIGIVDDLLAARGHGQNCQFFAVEHFEKIHKHDVHHLHVLASAVRLDGTWVDDSFERVKLKEIERQIEVKWGLQYCPPKPKGERTNTPIQEVKLREQGQTLIKDTLREAIDQAVADQPSMPLLVVRIKAQGYTMQFHEFDDGKGVSFGADGRCFKGRQLGDRFSFNGLHHYAGVDYQPQRDDPMLRQINEMSAEACQVLLAQLEQPAPAQPAALEHSKTAIAIQHLAELEDATQQVQDIWKHSRAGNSNLNAATFEGGYQIQPNPGGHPELYRAGKRVLEWSEDGYRKNGLNQNDLKQLRTWQRLTMQQLENQRARQAATEKKKQQQQPSQPRKTPSKSQGLEL